VLVNREVPAASALPKHLAVDGVPAVAGTTLRRALLRKPYLRLCLLAALIAPES
jgi:hypothetical protein